MIMSDPMRDPTNIWEIYVEFIKDIDTNENFITQAHDFIFKSSI